MRISDNVLTRDQVYKQYANDRVELQVLYLRDKQMLHELIDNCRNVKF